MEFHSLQFRTQVDDALETVKRILEVNRNPRLAEHVNHTYEDKYKLANLLTNTMIIAQMNCLERFGLTQDVLRSIDKTQATTLRFQASESCTFLKEQTVKVPVEGGRVETKESTETTGDFIGRTKKSTIHKVVNRIQEYHYKVGVQWEISVYSGTAMKERTMLQTRSSSMVVVIQSNKNRPIPEHKEQEPVDLSLTWLMQQINAEKLCTQFHIDTESSETKTPVRNKQIDEVSEFVSNICGWMGAVSFYFKNGMIRNLLDKHNPARSEADPMKTGPLRELDSSAIFVPIHTFMEETKGTVAEQEGKSNEKSTFSLTTTEEDSDGETTTPVFSTIDMNKLLDEQIRSMDEVAERLQKSYPGRQLVKLISVAEATLVTLCDHSLRLSIQYWASLEYIEKMLENQLVAAIGKTVRSSDLDQYVKYHNARLLNPAPQSFCHSIRRPDHYPDGLLSIESPDGEGNMEPIDTFVREIKSAAPLKVPLNAATTVELTGRKFLHGWLQHQFQTSHKAFTLVARARQFSSFLLVIGTMTGPDAMEPKDAIILQNKDEVFIPLILSQLPTAKEFKDATQSLSPEQQRFAKAFRSMQLESSVFGVCVIQIKPQLEVLLGLPPNALTKEMKMTQDLMKLFVEYQVPSDLLSFDGDSEATNVTEQVDNVRGNIESVLDVIDESKVKELEEQAMRADMETERRVAMRGPDESYEEESHEEVSYQAFRAPARAFGGGGFNFGDASASSSLFGAPAPAPSGCLFGGRAPAPAGSLFGAPAPAPAGSLFGARAPAPSGRPFGAPAPAPSGGLFGSAPAPSSGFGAGTQGFGGGGGFGAPAPALAFRGGSAFGAPAPAPNSKATNSVVSAKEQLQSTPNVFGKPQPSHVPMADSLADFQSAGKSSQDSSKGNPTNESLQNDNTVDFTAVPKILDAAVETYGSGSSLRSTVIKTSDSWTRKRQENLLTKMETKHFGSDDIKSEKNKAFDLLDALSRSGSLAIACSELHVIVSLTHCFDKDVMATIIEDNINPIESLEMSSLLVASTIHGVPAKMLLRDRGEIGRLERSFPALLESHQATDDDAEEENKANSLVGMSD